MVHKLTNLHSRHPRSVYSLPGAWGGSTFFFLGFVAFLAGLYDAPWDVCWLWHSSAERVPTIRATFAQ